MLGISRWTDKGGSYRTVQRFFQTAIPWGQVMWAFFCTHFRQAEDVYVLVGDECVVTKSGKLTHGLDCTEVTLTPELTRIQAMTRQFLDLVGSTIPLAYFVLDGHFGNNNALQMVRQCGLHLVSKLRYDAALYFSYEGNDKRRKYGGKIAYSCIPPRYLQETTIIDGLRTDIYQATTRHKEFAQALNVVIIVKTKLATGATARVILFSSDLTLGWAQFGSSGIQGVDNP